MMALSLIDSRKSMDSSKEGPAPTRIVGISLNLFWRISISGAFNKWVRFLKDVSRTREASLRLASKTRL